MLLGRRHNLPATGMPIVPCEPYAPVAQPLAANRVALDEDYYAWQIATIVLHLRELRRRRLARFSCRAHGAEA